MVTSEVIHLCSAFCSHGPPPSNTTASCWENVIANEKLLLKRKPLQKGSRENSSIIEEAIKQKVTCIPGNLLRDCRDRKILLTSDAKQTQPAPHCFQDKQNQFSGKRLDSTICHKEFILHSPGNWGDHLRLLIGFNQKKNKHLSL